MIDVAVGSSEKRRAGGGGLTAIVKLFSLNLLNI